MTEDYTVIQTIKVNNKKVTKMMDLGNGEEEVQIAPKEGFLIGKTNTETKKEEFEYYTPTFKGTILFDKYQIKSKYNAKDFYFSNEFDFGNLNNIRVYAPKDKRVLYEGDYNGAREHFSVGKMNDYGKPVTDYDLYVILYVEHAGNIFRFIEKLGRNCTWFKYKEEARGDGETKDYEGYRNYVTNFKLGKNIVAGNTFWNVTLLQDNAGNREYADMMASRIETELIDKESPKKKEEKTTIDYGTENEEVSEQERLDNIPF